MAKKNEIFFHIKRYRSKVLLAGFFCIITLTAAFTVAAVIFQRNVANDRDVGYCTDINLQMKKNIDNFLDGMNSTGRLLFSQKEYVNYDGTADDKELETKMNKFLMAASVIDNYADFGIVYDDEDTLGRISDGSRDLFNDEIYKRLSERLGGDMTGWYTGFYDEDKDKYDFGKLFYVKRINERAIFMSTCYATELESKFMMAFESDDLRAVLSDDRNMVIFDTKNRTSGKKLNTELVNLFSADKDTTVSNVDVIASSCSFDNGWQIITVIDMTPRRQLSVRFGLIALFMSALTCIAYELIVRALARRFDPEKNRLSDTGAVDPLTGLHNADYTELVILDKIETSLTGSTFVLMIVRIDNLDLINETYGEDIADEAVAKTAQAVDDLFGAEQTVGIMRRDEFAVFADFTDINLMKAYDDIRSSVSGLAHRLSRCELEGGRGEIRTSVGAAVYPDCTTDYDELLQLAEDAATECREDRHRDCVIYKKKGESKAREQKE